MASAACFEALASRSPKRFAFSPSSFALGALSMAAFIQGKFVVAAAAAGAGAGVGAGAGAGAVGGGDACSWSAARKPPPGAARSGSAPRE